MKNGLCIRQWYACIICFAMNLTGLLSGKVVFLYPEDREQVAFAAAQAQAQTPVMYLYQEGAEWCIFDVTNELMSYDRVYYAAAGERIRSRIRPSQRPLPWWYI